MGTALQPTVFEPKVSIVMATYRRPHTIMRTIAQIRAQTYANWELIVVNNAQAGDYTFDDPRIRVYRHAAHASASYARNQGLQYVTGELVCFFDDDDMFPTYLERLVQAFREHPEAKLARCGMYRSDDVLQVVRRPLAHGGGRPVVPCNPADLRGPRVAKSSTHWAIRPPSRRTVEHVGPRPRRVDVAPAGWVQPLIMSRLGDVARPSRR